MVNFHVGMNLNYSMCKLGGKMELCNTWLINTFLTTVKKQKTKKTLSSFLIFPPDGPLLANQPHCQEPSSQEVGERGGRESEQQYTVPTVSNFRWAAMSVLFLFVLYLFEEATVSKECLPVNHNWDSGQSLRSHEAQKLRESRVVSVASNATSLPTPMSLSLLTSM